MPTQTYPPNHSISHKNFKITKHAKLRASERLHIESEEEIRKLAKSAKYKGLNINVLRASSPNPTVLLTKFKLTLDDMKYLLERYRKSTKRTYYYYRNNIWVFNGGATKYPILLTIIPCDEEDRRIGNLVSEKGFDRFELEHPDLQYYKTIDDFKIEKAKRVKAIISMEEWQKDKENKTNEEQE